MSAPKDSDIFLLQYGTTSQRLRSKHILSSCRRFIWATGVT
jgi:hypothetical protein